MNFARKALVCLTVLFAIGNGLRFAFGSGSNLLYFAFLLATCVPGVIGIALFFARSRLKTSRAKFLADIVAFTFCMVTVAINFRAYYELASIPAMLAKEAQTIQRDNRLKQVYKFEEADFDVDQKKVVFWKTPGDRINFIEILYLITINEKMVMIVKKETLFLPVVHAFNGDKVVQVKVTMSDAKDDAFSAVGSFLLDDITYSFNYSMSEIKYGYDIDPIAPLMKSIFPGNR